MAHVDYRFRFFIIASIVSTILAIATANELAIESRPAPFTLIRSTAPHSNYATPPTTTAPYPSIAISPHVAGASSGADVQDLLPLLTNELSANYDSNPSRTPCPLHPDSESIANAPSLNIHAADLASITIAFAAAVSATKDRCLPLYPSPAFRPQRHKPCLSLPSPSSAPNPKLARARQ